MKKIKRAEDLPKWFRLADYDHLRDLGSAGWASVIERLLILQSLSVGDLERHHMELDEVFSEAITPPLSQVPDYVLLKYRCDPSRLRFRGVSSLSNSEVSYMALMFEQLPFGRKAVRFARAVQKYKTGGKISVADDALFDFVRQPFFMSLLDEGLVDQKALTPNRAISVNMELPDALLVEDFKEWLSAARDLDLHKAARKAFGPEDFAKWVDDQYAPLLLLTNWARLADAEITYNALAEALFPYRRRVQESHIRRSIRPAADAWLSGETGAALVAQAAKEAGQVLPPKGP